MQRYAVSVPAILLALRSSLCNPAFMLDRFSSFLIAITLIVLAMIISIISGSDWTHAGLLALAGISGSALLYAAGPMPIREPLLSYTAFQGGQNNGSLLQHPDFALWADQRADPIIGVRNNVVTIANDAAAILLGRHIVGEDIRTALRHPAAIEMFDRYDTSQDLDKAVDLSDYPRAGQRWSMRMAQLSGRDAIIFLEDRTEIDAADRMRSDFVANASHELRTPLAAILGYVETLQEMTSDDNPMHQRFLGIIDREAQRMQRLILDLLSISRVEADRFRRPTVQVDLSKIIRSTVSQLINSVEARPDDIVTDITRDPLMMYGDQAQLSQLAHNVIANAMKYGRPATPIYVSLHLEKGRAKFSVQDEGEGISANHLPRLTERFYRVDDARSRSVGGTGLGLAIVKHISERHQGQLTIDSKLGVGTTVTLSLPLIPPAEQSPARAGSDTSD